MTNQCRTPHAAPDIPVLKGVEAFQPNKDNGLI